MRPAMTDTAPDTAMPAEIASLVERLRADAEEIAGWGAGNEAGRVREAATLIEHLAARCGLGIQQPTIHAMFETVDPSVPVIGTTAAPIKRVEQNDDGSFTVVIDHWPRKGDDDHG